MIGSPLCDNDGESYLQCSYDVERLSFALGTVFSVLMKIVMSINSVVQMKFGDICKTLQPHGDIERFMKKKELMNAIIGKFVQFYIFFIHG